MKREFAIYICLVYCSILSKPIFGFDDVSSEFCKLENDANKAYIEHDRQFLSNLFADEFVHVNYRGGTVDKQGEIDFFASPKLTMKAAAVDHCTAHKYGNVALVTGINTWTETIFNGNDLSGAYRFTRVYLHRQWRWQIVASQYSKLTS